VLWHRHSDNFLLLVFRNRHAVGEGVKSGRVSTVESHELGVGLSCFLQDQQPHLDFVVVVVVVVICKHLNLHWQT
jgi:hypothetical protein